MTDLPPLAHGRVVGRFVAGVADSADAGDAPDVVPLAGTLTFTLSVAALRVVSASPVPTTIYPQPITATLDADGYLTHNGSRGVSLLATDDPATNPTDLQYTVTLNLWMPETSNSVTAPSWRFALPGGSEVDLTQVAPIETPAPNTIILKGERGDPGPNIVPTNQAVADAVSVDGPAKEALLSTIDAAITAALADFEGGDGAFWQAAFAQPASADMPTITVVPYALDSTEQLTREKRASTDGPADMAGDTHFRYDGALAYPANASSASYVSTGLLTDGSAQAARYQTRIQTITSPLKRVKIRVRPAATAMAFRIKVGGRWVSKEVQRVTGLAAGAAHMVVLDFPTYASRLIEYEDSGGTGFGGMAAELGGTFTRPEAPAREIRLAVLGDSYSGGAANPPDGAGRMETWVNFFARMIGATSLINFAIGGTGFTTASPFINRVPDVLAFNPTHVVVFGSRNDGANPGAPLQSAVATVLDQLKNVPNVYVSGPSTSGFASNNATVKAATLAAGRPFLDGITGAWITDADLGSDNVHPTFAGHQKIARGFFAAMKAVGEKPLAYVPAPDIGDDFNRTDTTAGLGASSIGAANWAAAGGGSSGIESGRAYVNTPTVSLAYRLLSAASTGVWDWDVPVVGSSKAPKLVFNYSDGNNHFRVYGDGTSWKLQRRTTAAGNVDVATLGACADGDHVRVRRLANDTVTIWLNGTQVYNATEVAIGSAFGIAGSNTNTDTRYDNITHTPVL